MMIICFVVRLTEERRLALFPARTIVRDPHHRESATCREQGLNLRRTRVQALLSEVVQQRYLHHGDIYTEIFTTPRRNTTLLDFHKSISFSFEYCFYSQTRISFISYLTVSSLTLNHSQGKRVSLEVNHFSG